MLFRVWRESLMEIEGVEDETEAFLVMRSLSVDTQGMTMLFQGRPITYVQHIKTVVKLEEPQAVAAVDPHA